jgi:multidomain signaling protein FimX
MAIKTDNALRLLVIEDSVEDAESLVSMLRNGGIVVRPTRPEDQEDFEEAVAKQSFDLVLANANARSVPLGTVQDLIQSIGKDLPLITVLQQATAEQIVDMLKKGVRDVVFRGNPEHVQLVVRREFESLRTRRSLRRLEVSLRETEKRAAALLDSSRDPITYVHEGMHVYANRAYLEMFNFEEFNEIEGTPILDMVAPAAAERLKALLRGLSKGEKPPAQLQIVAQKPHGGESFDAVMEFSEASIDGEPCTQIVFRQQSANPELVKQLEGLKTQDLVTGLLNRQAFNDALDDAIAAAQQGRGERMLILIEIDRFKGALDQVGMGGADLILGDTAQVIRAKLSEADQAGRIGDHTFVALLKESTLKECEARAQVLRKAIEDHLFETGKQSINLTASLGVTTIGERTRNTSEVMGHATAACKAAQDAGGNQVRVHDPRAKDREAEERNAHWVALVKDAIARNHFVLFYQPIVSLHGETGEFYEVLLRMQSPRGEILPKDFMPPAEAAGLLPQIDRWVIERAIDILAERRRTGTKTTFFIKITPQSLEEPTLLPWLANKLKAVRLAGEALVFEMPESKAQTSLRAARTFQQGLAQLHCGFALEQFGSGIQSFQMLKHLPANYLKIDRSFMTELAKTPENQQKVKEITDQAHAAGRLTIAEFVEDAASMSILWQCGVNFVQGNFLQEPEKVLAYDFNG